MKTYRLSQDYIRASIRRLWLVFVPLIILVISLIVATNVNFYNKFGMIQWEVVITEVVVILAAVSCSFFFTIRNQQSIYRSVRIELDVDGVSRSQLRIPPVRIARCDIAEIRAIRQGLCIQSTNKFRSLAILTGLVDENGAPADAEIRATLESWSPIKPAPASLNVKTIFLTVAVFAAWIVINNVNQIWIVLPIWLAFTGYLLHELIQLRHYQGVDPKFRRNLTLIYGFLIFQTGVKIIYYFLAILSGFQS